MNLNKKSLKEIEKCYAICPIETKGKNGFLIATEKSGGCFLFDEDGNFLEKVWDSPGGVMSMVVSPWDKNSFFSTQEFYSPNDSSKSRVVMASPKNDGWDVRTVCELPFLHRFDIFEFNGKKYFIGCTLKSEHNFKNDWNHPGAVYVQELPDEIDESFKLEPKILINNLTKNHGYSKAYIGNKLVIVVSAEEGVFFIYPPTENSEWKYEKVLDQATSDALIFDIDEDGKPELFTYSSFHGDHLDIWRNTTEGFKKDWSFPEPMPFIHSLWAGYFNEKPIFFSGHRQGKRNLYAITYNKELSKYEYEIVDEDNGSTNVAVYKKNKKDILISANREINEVAIYFQ